MRIVIACLFAFVLSGCDEIGANREGKNKAFLILKNEDEIERDFFIGGYEEISKCLDVLKYETESYERKNGEFWTNPEFNYGGVRQDGWVRNQITGAKCVQMHK